MPREDREYRSRDDDDDRGYRRQRMPERDEYGRFMSDDDRGGRSGYRSRSRDDDERSGSGRGGCGWFGVPGSHCEASHHGWCERYDERGGRYSWRRDDDDDRGSRRQRMPERDESGRFMSDDD